MSPALLVLTLLLATGIPLQSVVVLFVLFFTMVWLAEILPLGLKEDQSVVPSLAAVTLVFGSITLLVVASGGIRSASGIVAALAIPIILVTMRLRTGGNRGTGTGALLIPSLVLLTLLSLVSKLFLFLIPLTAAVGTGVALQGVSLFSNRPSVERARRIAPLLVVAAAFWSRSMSMTGWSEGMVFRSMDQWYRTSVGVTASRFGVASHPGAIGHPLDYHWLSEAMMGLLGQISGAPTLALVLVLSPIAGTFATVAGAVVLARQLGMRHVHGFVAAALLTTFSTMLYPLGVNVLKPTEMGQFWGTPVFIVVLICLLNHVRIGKLSTSVLLVTSIALLSLTNVTLFAVALVTACIALLVAPRSNLTRPWTMLASGIACVGIPLALVLVYVTPAANKDFPVQLQVFPPMQFGLVFGYNGTHWYVSAASAIACLLVMAVQSGGGLLSLAHTIESEVTKFGRTLLLTSASIGVLLSAIIKMPNAEQYRFSLPVLIAGPFLTAGLLPRIIGDWKKGSLAPLSIVIAAGLVLGYMSEKFLPKTFGGSEVMLPRIAFVGSAFVLALILWFLLRATSPRTEPSRRAPRPLIAVVVPLFLSASVSHALINTANQVDYAFGKLGPSTTETEKYACLEHIRDTSSPSAIIASTMWGTSPDYTQRKRYLATAVAERRSFVDGPYYVMWNPETWLEERMKISLHFARNPNSADLDSLRDAGVDLFVIDRDEPHTTDWNKFGTIQFKNDRCIVVRLDK